MRIHFIAIGGSIMHSLAIAVAALGHKVTGSDDEIYEPSRTRLADAGLLPEGIGWDPDRITGELDLVVLGMHARADNPELIRAMEAGVRVMSFPEFMYEMTQDKIRVVVAGSHGKTSTTGMIAHILDECGVAADRMIGAQIGTLKPVTLTDAGIIVLEGDEYLSSPVDRRAKFLHYRPHIAIITGIAWDHMNVFPTYDQYLEPFRVLITSLPADAKLIYFAGDTELENLIRESKPVCHLIPYDAIAYRTTDHMTIAESTSGKHIALQIFGKHNMQNLAAAIHATSILNIPEEDALLAMRTFTGAQKRLQKIAEDNTIVSYLDFAHAPSKVRATVQAVRERYPDRKIVAILELHTFSSLNPEFLPQYADTLVGADECIVYYSPHTLEMKKLPPLTKDMLKKYFNATELRICTSTAELKTALADIHSEDPMVMLWMSSGRFDGFDIVGWKSEGNSE